MDTTSQPRIRPTYYFSLLDQEILDDQLLSLSCDDETWLYKSEIYSFNEQYKHFQLDSSFQNHYTPSASGSVDSRTYTRRKHPMQTTPQSVVESSFSNRSSLGLLSPNKLLNESILMSFAPIPTSENLGKTSLNSIASNNQSVPQRIFKLDSPFLNTPGVAKEANYTFDINRIDSESSDSISIPQSLENLSVFGKNGAMTDSLVNFLEKQDVGFKPPTAFQDEGHMTDSLISIPENCHKQDIKVEPMTDSLVNFLLPVHCEPPSGFEDCEIKDSIVNIDSTNILRNCDLTKSVVDYLEDVKCNLDGSLIQSTTSSETENIPPHGGSVIKVDVINSCTKATSDVLNEKSINSTFEIDEKYEDETFNICNENTEVDNITFTNTVNITRKRHDRGDHEDNFNLTKTINASFDKEFAGSKHNSMEANFKSKALNNRDLNIVSDLKSNEFQDSNLDKIKEKDFITTKFKSTLPNNKNGLIKNGDINGTFTKLPSRNSTFNTTFTKLESPEHSSNYLSKTKLMFTANKSKSPKGFNSTFVAKSSEILSGELDDDQTSSASDSSFSSSSTKPRSVDELRTIAKQQENSLVQQTSTPTDCGMASSSLAQLNLELSPIRRQSLEGSSRVVESRSANSSPVRSPHPRISGPHAISQFQQSEIRKQSLQASSLSNIAGPKVSGLRVPRVISRLPAPRQSIARPSTAPTPKVTGIPRPQLSRLPKPTQFRPSGIPGLKRGGGYH